MNQHIADVRRQLGELGAMAAQTEAMERKILERAVQRLAQVEATLDAACEASASKPTECMSLVEERRQLLQVIEQARYVLIESA